MIGNHNDLHAVGQSELGNLRISGVRAGRAQQHCERRNEDAAGFRGRLNLDFEQKRGRYQLNKSSSQLPFFSSGGGVVGVAGAGGVWPPAFCAAMAPASASALTAGAS